MSDINTQQDQEVVSVVDDNAPSGGMSDFDRNLEMFLQNNFEPDEPDAGGDGEGSGPGQEGEAPTGQPAPAQQNTGAAPQTNQVPANGGQPPANDGTDAQVEVDPNLLLKMMGGEKPAQTQQPQGQEQPKTGEASSPAPAGSNQTEAYAPFKANFKLPPAIVKGIFESEDVAEREQALVAVMAGFANSVIEVMEKRIEEHHAPRFSQNFVQQQQQAQAAMSIKQDFDTSFPDLVPYNQFVRRAFEVLAEQNPTMDYSEAKAQVAALARKAVQQVTGKAPTAPAQNGKTITKPNTGQVFIADGARPGGIVQPNASDSPASMLDELSAF